MNTRLTCLFLAALAAIVSGQDPNADAEFLLWTRSNRVTQDHLFTGNAAGLASSHYSSAKLTKIYIHGWLMDGYDSTALAMRDAFLGREDCNLISVNWEKYSKQANYYDAARQTALVGRLTGDFINFLVAQGTPLRNIHIVGFSLGAQVAGDAGARTSSGKVARITGLDPAYPAFSMSDTTTRLDPSDATFVDVIHTNSGTLTELGLSFPENIGHVDFWPNGDAPQAQPGCAVPGPDIVDLATGCSHGRAPEYFIESVKGGTPFTATKCTSFDAYAAGSCNNNAKTSMGYPVSTSATGAYYLRTARNAPYALG